MAIQRIPVVWSGIPTGPGVSVFYGAEGSVVNDDLSTFFTAIKGLIPTGTSIIIPSSGDTISEATGDVAGTWTGAAGGSIVCNGAASHAAGVGGVVQWMTGGIVNGRRVKGRTFLVPLFASAYDNNGTLIDAQRNTIQTAVDALVVGAGGNLMVWHRPTSGVGGSAHAITSGKVSDTVAVLKSRRR